jgi:hypothetical protein
MTTPRPRSNTKVSREIVNSFELPDVLRNYQKQSIMRSEFFELLAAAFRLQDDAPIHVDSSQTTDISEKEPDASTNLTTITITTSTTAVTAAATRKVDTKEAAAFTSTTSTVSLAATRKVDTQEDELCLAVRRRLYRGNVEKADVVRRIADQWRKKDPATIQRYIRSVPNLPYLQVSQTVATVFPQEMGVNSDTEPLFDVLVRGRSGNKPIQMILDTGSQRVELPYVLIEANEVKTLHEVDGVHYGVTTLEIDGQVFDGVPFSCDRLQHETEITATDSITQTEVDEMDAKVALAAAVQANDPEVEQIKLSLAEIADTLARERKQVRWVWGVQRLLGRMGFLSRFPFQWLPSPEGVIIKFEQPAEPKFKRPKGETVTDV